MENNGKNQTNRSARHHRTSTRTPATVATRSHNPIRLAAERGVSLTLFRGWDSIVEQALFWTSLPKLDAARAAVTLIRDRLRAVEAFAEAVALWDKLSSA